MLLVRAEDVRLPVHVRRIAPHEAERDRRVDERLGGPPRKAERGADFVERARALAQPLEQAQPMRDQHRRIDEQIRRDVEYGGGVVARECVRHGVSTETDGAPTRAISPAASCVHAANASNTRSTGATQRRRFAASSSMPLNCACSRAK